MQSMHVLCGILPTNVRSKKANLVGGVIQLSDAMEKGIFAFGWVGEDTITQQPPWQI